MIRVLLADDSDLILERLQQMLRLNPQVEIAGSFKDGLTKLEALKCLKRDLAMRYGADYFFSKVDDFEKISPVVNELAKTPAV